MKTLNSKNKKSFETDESALEKRFSNVLIKIQNVELEYFNNVTGSNYLVKYTALLAIYTGLVGRYFTEPSFSMLSESKIEDDFKKILKFSFLIDRTHLLKDHFEKIKLEVLRASNDTQHNGNNVQELYKYKFIYNIDKLELRDDNDCPFQLFVEHNNSGDIELSVKYKQGFVLDCSAQQFLTTFKNWILYLKNYITLPLYVVPVLTDVSIDTILNNFNSTSKDYPYDKTIVDLFELQVLKTPNAIAILYLEITYTYEELNARVNQVANFLIDNFSIKKNDIIGILMPKSENSLIALLAILKSGAAFLPIDISYPKYRIEYIVKDSNLKLLISDEMNYDRIDFKEKLNFDNIGFTLNSANPLIAISPNDLAYIIYTSGSTGEPKGVMIEHRSNVNMSLSQIEIFEINKTDRIVWFASISFDASISEIMMAFYSGSTLAIPTQDITRDKDEFVSFLKNTRSTVITFPPSYLDILSDDDICGLRTIITAGEPAHVKKAAETSINKNYFNAYGPTECAVCVSIYKTNIGDLGKATIPIGRPIANMRVYVLDDFLQLMPIGAPGKLFVSGMGVGRGYLNKIELTKEKFIQNPFLDQELMYDTGDIGRWLPDGNIEFLGRNDDQIKIRGYRIELGEIENVLLSISNIKQAVVSVKKNDDKNTLVAYVVFVDQSLDNKELRKLLLAKLPDYMIPAVFIVLNELPVTVSGKIDKIALSAFDILNNDEENNKFFQDGIEKRLLKIWQDVLGVQNISVNDNFFALGGHSLLVGKIVNRIREDLYKTVYIRDIFDFPTIKGLRSKLKDDTQNRIRPAKIEESYPLTPGQKSIWIQENLEKDKCLYNITSALEINGKLDIDKLNLAFKILIENYEILRTVFKLDESGDIRQFILDTKEIDFNIQLIKGKKITKKLIKEIIHFENVYSFDLERFPLFRIRAIKQNTKNHAIIFNIHHLITDGWSMELIKDKLLKIYNNLNSDSYVNSDFSPEIQFKDYACWIYENLNDKSWKDQEAYWLGQFEDMSPPLEISSLNVNQKEKSFNGARLSCEISSSLYVNVSSFSSIQNVTLFTTLLAGINCILYRYSDQTDITIGVPIANRDRLETEEQIGLFLNIVPIRTKLIEKFSFTDVIHQLDINLINSYQNSILPFEVWGLKTSCTQNALFNVMVVLQNQKNIFTETSDEFSVKEINIANRTTSQYDLIFRFSEGNSLNLSIEYNSDKFSLSFIKKMITHFAALLQKMMDEPLKSVVTINYLIENEQHILLEEFNATYQNYPLDKTVVDLFEERAFKKPDSIAVIYKTKNICYRDISLLSNQFAHYLLDKLVISLEDRISIKLDKSEWLIIALLGIMKTGAAYVPIDPNYTEERKTYLEEYSDCKFSIDEKVLNDFINEKDNFSNYLPSIKISPENLFHIMFTSGSTGQPKGVMLEHRNIVNFVTTNNYFKLNEKTILLSTVATSFDTTNMEFWGVLVNGGTVVLEKKEILFDYNKLNNLLKYHQINSLWITASWFPQIVEYNIEIFDGLKQFISGGDVISRKHINILKTKYPQLNVLNGYGPTETTTFSTVYKLNKYHEQAIPIGKPIKNTYVYILNDYLLPQPIGVFGELYIGGQGVARGYLYKSDLTNERFLNNPFKPGEKMYKTGDLVRWNEDGNIEFKGRKDSQVKIRGHRIDLREIEDEILNFLGISEVAVVFSSNYDGPSKLIAYLVTTIQIDAHKLKSHLSEKLPEYMIPESYRQVRHIPVNANGKLDRKKLSDNYTELEVSMISSKFIISAAEQKLFQIWTKILKTEELIYNDSFMEFGGHSLNVVEFMMHIQKEFQVKLSIKEIFLNRSISALCNLIILKEKEVYLSIPQFNSKDYYDISFAQRRIWIQAQTKNGSIAYNSIGAFVINATLEPKTIFDSTRDLVDKYEILRTIFIQIKGAPKQKVLSDIDPAFFEVIDLTNVINKEEKIKNIVSNESKLLFNLEEGPLFRVKVLYIGKNEFLYLFNLHHIINDGWSIGVLIKELILALHSRQSYENYTYSKLRIQYKDYSEWQNDLIKRDVLGPQKEFWLSQFNNFTKVPIKTDFERPTSYGFAGAYEKFNIGDKSFNRIKEYIIDNDATFFMFYTSIIGLVIYEQNGNADVVIGTLTANREHRDLLDQIGFFANTLAIRLKIPDLLEFDMYFSNVKNTVIDCFQNQEFPFDLLVEELRPKRNGRTPFFDVMIILQNNEVLLNDINAPQIIIEKYELDSDVYAKADLIFEFVKNNEFRIIYDPNLFKKETILSMKDRFDQLINKYI